MSNISSLSNVHKIGLFGDYQNKNENNLIKIKEIKINIIGTFDPNFSTSLPRNVIFVIILKRKFI